MNTDILLSFTVEMTKEFIMTQKKVDMLLMEQRENEEKLKGYEDRLKGYEKLKEEILRFSIEHESEIANCNRIADMKDEKIKELELIIDEQAKPNDDTLVPLPSANISASSDSILPTSIYKKKPVSDEITKRMYKPKVEYDSPPPKRVIKEKRVIKDND